jgi:serine/threonine protein kinase/Tol biopolymer transport system component
LTDQLDSPWLIALAADVCDGKVVDWERAREQSDGPQTEAVIRGLQRLARVVGAHRGEAAAAGGAAEPSEPKVWRHLILLEEVGRGAFGTVYRAWDAQLQREVALKRVTPSGRAPWTEAQHLARIRHPKVVTVYGAEQDDHGVGIWMEFIEGQTLAASVRERGAMSGREVAGIGIDVCRALSALHAAGLLHRDIKAQNVMREVGGRIVLMDFSGTGALAGGSTTEVSGTPLYMAPELFDGHPASTATDTYSVGVLLFHLFSGRLPVEGSSLANVRAAHKERRRIRLRDLRPDLPDTIVQIVERATSPEPSLRYQTAGDFEHALAGVLTPHVAAVSPVTTAVEHDRRSRTFAWVLAATTLGITALIAGLFFRAQPAAPAPEIHFTIGPPYNSGSWPRVSPDGRYVVFGATVENQPVFWLRPLGASDGRPIANTVATETPFWSWDSRQLGFFAEGKLKVVDSDGGHVETLADVAHPCGGDWNADGVLLFGSDTGIHRIAHNGTGPLTLTTLDKSRGEYRHCWPEFLPDGRHFLYIARSRESDQTSLYLASLDSATRKRIMPGYSRMAYAPTGHLLYVRNGVLFAQPFDAGAGELHGDPVALATSVKFHPSDDAAFDVSTNGVLIYRFNEGLSTTRLVLLDRRGRELHSLAPAGFFGQPRLSPDGSRVAVEKRAAGDAMPDIWMFDVARKATWQLTRNPAPDLRPVWSPDGREVVFSSKRGGSFDIYRRVVDQVQEEEILWASEDNKRVEDWSRDGRLLAVSVPRKGLWTFDLRTRTASLVRTITGADNGMQAEFSPDAKFIAYGTEETGRPEVYVQRLDGSGARWQISTDGGCEPHWRDQGRELTFVDPEGWMTAVDVPTGDRWKPETPRRLFRVSLPALFSGSNISMSANSERMVVNSFVADPTVPAIHVIANAAPLAPR